MTKKPVHQRFSALTETGPVHPRLGTPCLLWRGTVNNAGRGQFHLNGRTVQATHVAWWLKTGEWPQQQVLHRCDVERCVREDHLFEGTQADNLADMVAKGRQNYGGRQRGELRWNAKLTPSKVLEIRTSDESLSRLASRFGIAKSTVAAVRRGQTWK